MEDIWLECFEDCVNEKFPHQNVRNVEQRWKAAPEVIQTQFLKAGYQKGGLWSEFIKVVRAPGASLDTARKQHR